MAIRLTPRLDRVAKRLGRAARPIVKKLHPHLERHTGYRHIPYGQQPQLVDIDLRYGNGIDVSDADFCAKAMRDGGRILRDAGLAVPLSMAARHFAEWAAQSQGLAPRQVAQWGTVSALSVGAAAILRYVTGFGNDMIDAVWYYAADPEGVQADQLRNPREHRPKKEYDRSVDVIVNDDEGHEISMTLLTPDLETAGLDDYRRVETRRLLDEITSAFYILKQEHFRGWNEDFFVLDFIGPSGMAKSKSLQVVKTQLLTQLGWQKISGKHFKKDGLDLYFHTSDELLISKSQLKKPGVHVVDDTSVEIDYSKNREQLELPSESGHYDLVPVKLKPLNEKQKEEAISKGIPLSEVRLPNGRYVWFLRNPFRGRYQLKEAELRVVQTQVRPRRSVSRKELSKTIYNRRFQTGDWLETGLGVPVMAPQPNLSVDELRRDEWGAVQGMLDRALENSQAPQVIVVNLNSGDLVNRYWMDKKVEKQYGEKVQVYFYKTDYREGDRDSEKPLVIFLESRGTRDLSNQLVYLENQSIDLSTVDGLSIHTQALTHEQMLEYNRGCRVRGCNPLHLQDERGRAKVYYLNLNHSTRFEEVRDLPWDSLPDIIREMRQGMDRHRSSARKMTSADLPLYERVANWLTYTSDFTGLSLDDWVFHLFDKAKKRAWSSNGMMTAMAYFHMAQIEILGAILAQQRAKESVDIKAFVSYGWNHVSDPDFNGQIEDLYYEYSGGFSNTELLLSPALADDFINWLARQIDQAGLSDEQKRLFDFLRASGWRQDGSFEVVIDPPIS